MVAALTRLSAASLEKVWQIDLNGVTKERGFYRDQPILAIRFSPSGRSIAIVSGWIRSSNPPAVKSRLLILSAERPAIGVREFEINAGAEDHESGGQTAANLQWSPAEDAIDAAGDIVHLTGAETCQISYHGGFISSDKLVARALESGSLSHLVFFDPECRAAETWNVAESWEIEDVSAQRGLLAIWADGEPLVVDALLKKVVQRWPKGTMPSAFIRFADNGSAICGGDSPQKFGKAPFRCWDVASGKQIAEAPSLSGGLPFATSERVSRLIASNQAHIAHPFSHFGPDSYGEALLARVIWDFKNGKELLSWDPPLQTYRMRLINSPKLTQDHFKFAISPDGGFVVEGGNGIVRLYRIQQ